MIFLLHAPQVRDTEVFTRLPDHFRRTGVRSDWADANRGGQPTDSFLEGPVFDGAGNLYVTDIPFGRIFRIDPQGGWICCCRTCPARTAWRSRQTSGCCTSG